MANLLAENLFRIHPDTVAVITGGATGIGLIIARTLSINGARRVYILGPDANELDLAVSQSPIKNRPLVPILCDITSKLSLGQAVSRIEQEAKYINLFVANAGVPGPQRPGMLMATHFSDKQPSPTEYADVFWEGADMAEFSKTFHVNVTGSFYSILAFLPLLEAGNAHVPSNTNANSHNTNDGERMPRSHILLTSSASGLMRNLAAFAPAYAASKAALLHMTKSLSTLSATHGWRIRVNALCPHLVCGTGFTASSVLPFMAGQNGKAAHEEGGVEASVNPAGRVLGEEDVAGAMLWVAGRAGEMVDGMVVLVDGGKVGVVPGVY